MRWFRKCFELRNCECTVWVVELIRNQIELPTRSQCVQIRSALLIYKVLPVQKSKQKQIFLQSVVRHSSLDLGPLQILHQAVCRPDLFVKQVLMENASSRLRNIGQFENMLLLRFGKVFALQ